MGWNAGAEVLDAAIEGAVQLLAAYRPSMIARGDDRLDEALRPFVKRIAGVLNKQDWDTWDESKYFDRFPQEILGHDDAEHLEWLEEQVSYCTPGSKWEARATAFRAAMIVKYGHGWLEDNPH